MKSKPKKGMAMGGTTVSGTRGMSSPKPAMSSAMPQAPVARGRNAQKDAVGPDNSQKRLQDPNEIAQAKRKADDLIQSNLRKDEQIAMQNANKLQKKGAGNFTPKLSVAGQAQAKAERRAAKEEKYGAMKATGTGPYAGTSSAQLKLQAMQIANAPRRAATRAKVKAVFDARAAEKARFDAIPRVTGTTTKLAKGGMTKKGMAVGGTMMPKGAVVTGMSTPKPAMSSAMPAMPKPKEPAFMSNPMKPTPKPAMSTQQDLRAKAQKEMEKAKRQAQKDMEKAKRQAPTKSPMPMPKPQGHAVMNPGTRPMMYNGGTVKKMAKGGMTKKGKY